MYEVFYPTRDDWGSIIWVKVRTPSFFKKFKSAVKAADKHGKYAYVHKYGTPRAVYTSFQGEPNEVVA
jgi:hypothetical protein